MIHSSTHVSDKNKLLFISKTLNDELGLFHTIPVLDLDSFETIRVNGSDTELGKDNHHIYIKNIDTKISSIGAEVIRLNSPAAIILQNDVLHYIYPSHRKVETTFKELSKPLVAKYNDTLGSFRHDTFYHFKVEGFAKAQQIHNSQWVKDNSGVFYIDGNKILKVSEITPSHCAYDKDYPKYLKTSDSLYNVISYPFKVNRFSKNAEILNTDIVRDNHTIFVKGNAVPEADAQTFARTKRGYGFVDKNFYYGSYDLSYRKAIPNWAYQEFLEGKDPNDLFGIDMGYDYTRYRSYWNGFLVSFSVPTLTNESKTILLEFKNIERKTQTLAEPIEEQLFLFYEPHNKEHTHLKDKNALFTVETPYEYTNIIDEQTIKLSVSVNQELIQQLTQTLNGQELKPALILSTTENPSEADMVNLFIRGSIH